MVRVPRLDHLAIHPTPEMRIAPTIHGIRVPPPSTLGFIDYTDIPGFGIFLELSMDIRSKFVRTFML
ncbi:uncharacterized protein EI90DRAFT_3029951 [Cantharellus anzutake]|uniref:uncharacterized protein n=1 Tax=Cantharellus anzutake TaxID=1750568 RepID=UPI0019058BC6|nr:uncharacterized protein EI90DRAFT_3029951 [Cantharellus anzutake]KAF8342704.1 hypothetical protein EI90DRAFT_3029951 [Cantharellus anzutake]